MAGNLIVKDRITCEQGRLYQCLRNGRIKVLMDTGEVREYFAKDLVATLASSPVAELSKRRRLKQ
ncbi:hypothetical protein [Endozoicomonas sp. 8E]|uniref:hypothetical protein n=1 Tax=Endozoicomonas sp. 8E TaxID=3035692 RepID=UPI002938F327|nr:hypothetical protein [Endozoicomonas sp. 8E]WOG27976.1 hypothetical protein P6910_26115 [Endozoicomonas sp. 8E]